MKALSKHLFGNLMTKKRSIYSVAHKSFTQLSIEEKLKQEKVETPEEVKVKSEQLALLIEHSKHFICFTGAGISTSVGIPDYRSTSNTIIQTGAGEYERPDDIR